MHCGVGLVGGAQHHESPTLRQEPARGPNEESTTDA